MLHIYIYIYIYDISHLRVNETRIFSTYFRKILNLKFNDNPSSGSRVYLCGPKDGQTDLTKIIVVFRDFVLIRCGGSSGYLVSEKAY